jgi:diguanylate cyclase (GGDEF)-like protein
VHALSPFAFHNVVRRLVARVPGWVPLLFFLLVSVQANAINPNIPLADLVHDTWTVDNGLPQSTIRDIARTRDGYLWFATHEGVARFDGRQFAIFNEANTPALRGSGVASLLEAKDGGLYLGLRDGGLVRYFGGDFVAVKPTGGLPKGTISAIAEDAAGALWVGSSGGGMARIAKGAAKFFTAAEGLPHNTVTAIYPAKSGDVWVGTFAGLSVVRGNAVIAQPTGDKLDTTYIASFFEDRQGSLWIATYGEGLYQLVSGGLKHFTQKDGLGSNTINRVYEDKDGALWLGSLEGMQRWHAGKFDSFTSIDGLTNKFVRDIIEDDEGNVWVGTDRGIDRFRQGVISNWGLRHGLVEEFTRTVLEDAKGNTWIGTADGLFQFRRANGGLQLSTPIRFTTKEGLANNAILSFAESADGGIWVGGNAGGLHRIRNGKVENVAAQFGLGAASVRSILETRDQSVWVGTNAGLFHRDAKGNISLLRIAEGLASEQVTALYEDSKQILWVGTRDGLSRIQDGRVLPRTDNLAIDGNILAITVDAEGHLLLATGNGLAVMRADRLLVFRKEHGIPARAFFNVVDDRRGSIWMCSNQGLVRILKSELAQLIDAGRTRVEPVLYGRSEGMATVQCNGGSGPAAWRARDGRLLFATARGVAVVDPAIAATPVSMPPPVRIQEVEVDSVAVAFRDGLKTAPGQHRVEIGYVALNLSDPDRIRYRYRLHGFDPGWIEAGGSRKAVYTNIEPGTYRFEVIASNQGGDWQQEGASLEIEHRAHVWDTMGFRIILALGFLVGVFAFFRLRVARLRRYARKLSQQVEERTHDLALQKEQLERANEDKARLLTQVQEKSEAYEKLAKEDSLTGIANRREFDRVLATEFARAARTQRPVAVILGDVDHFKLVNDEFGHAIGDEVLRVVAQLLHGGSRSLDRVARYGGEEFAIVLPETNLTDALALCERLRLAILKYDWTRIHPGLSLTMSFGVAANTDLANAPGRADRGALAERAHTAHERLLSLADVRLYQAKAEGRNRVIGHSASATALG